MNFDRYTSIEYRVTNDIFDSRLAHRLFRNGETFVTIKKISVDVARRAYLHIHILNTGGKNPRWKAHAHFHDNRKWYTSKDTYLVLSYFNKPWKKRRSHTERCYLQKMVILEYPVFNCVFCTWREWKNLAHPVSLEFYSRKDFNATSRRHRHYPI